MNKQISAYDHKFALATKDLKAAQLKIDTLQTQKTSASSATTKLLEKELLKKTNEGLKKDEELGRLKVEKITSESIIKEKTLVDQSLKESFESI